MEEKKKEDKEVAYNYQYPKKEVIKEIKKEKFEVVLIGKNFLILNNSEGNNIRVICPDTSKFSVNEKIYKENGIFLWERK
jgi:hypothetical protein